VSRRGAETGTGTGTGTGAGTGSGQDRVLARPAAHGRFEEARGAGLAEGESHGALAAPGVADLEDLRRQAFVGFGRAQADPQRMVLGWGLCHEDQSAAPADVGQPGGQGEELLLTLPPSEPDDIGPRGVPGGAAAFHRRRGEPSAELVQEPGSLGALNLRCLFRRRKIAADRLVSGNPVPGRTVAHADDLTS
jgi:hypothetical protein